MNPNWKKQSPRQAIFMSELLVLPDGRILVHNLTQPMAKLLRELNPEDRQIAPRDLAPRAAQANSHHEP